MMLNAGPHVHKASCTDSAAVDSACCTHESAGRGGNEQLKPASGAFGIQATTSCSGTLLQRNMRSLPRRISSCEVLAAGDGLGC